MLRVMDIECEIRMILTSLIMLIRFLTVNGTVAGPTPYSMCLGGGGSSDSGEHGRAIMTDLWSNETRFQGSKVVVIMREPS